MDPLPTDITDLFNAMTVEEMGGESGMPFVGLGEETSPSLLFLASEEGKLLHFDDLDGQWNVARVSALARDLTDRLKNRGVRAMEVETSRGKDYAVGALLRGVRESLTLGCVMRADLLNGDEVRLDSGPLRAALRASSSIPGLLPPVDIDGRRLVDGGVVAEVPVAAARALGGSMIVVDTSMDLPPYAGGGVALDTMMRTQLMTSRLLRDQQLRRVRHLIRPRVGHATWADWSRLEELVEAGRSATRSFLQPG